MTKITREKMLYAAIDQFMESINFYDIDNGWLCGNITHTLERKTQNKQTNQQMYTLKLPQQFIIGYQDVVEHGISREEPIYNEQKIPNVRDFTASFHAYFQNCYLTTRTNKGIEYNLSYMDVIPEPRNAELTAEYTLMCVYYKSHKPYPMPPCEMDHAQIPRLKDTIRMLEETEFAQRSRIQTLRERIGEERIRRRKEVRRLNTKCADNHMHMQNHIKKMYAEKAKFDDCPVCYEEMKPAELVVPACCHYICTNCIVKCYSCPLCRQDYDSYLLQKYESL